MSALSQGPFSYNRFDEIQALYESIYESKEEECDDDEDEEDDVSPLEKSAIKKEVKKHNKDKHSDDEDGEEDDKESDEDEEDDEKPKFTVKEAVCEYLLDEGFANNEVSAEVMFSHMSEGWVESIVEKWQRPPVDKMNKQASKHRGYATLGTGEYSNYRTGPKGEDRSTVAIQRNNKMADVMNSPSFGKYQKPKTKK